MLTNFYAQYNPSKLEMVPHTLARFKGREQVHGGLWRRGGGIDLGVVYKTKKYNPMCLYTYFSLLILLSPCSSREKDVYRMMVLLNNYTLKLWTWKCILLYTYFSLLLSLQQQLCPPICHG